MSNAREETTIRSTRVLVFLLGCLLVTAVIANDAAQAGSKPGTGPDDGAGSSLSEAVPSDARHEGIQVHGHWTIEVREPDGTRVSYDEFDNALASPPVGNGANMLA